MEKSSEPRHSKPRISEHHGSSSQNETKRNKGTEKATTNSKSKRRDYHEIATGLRSKFTWAGNANLWLVLGTWALAVVGILSLRDSADSISRSQRAWAGPNGASIDGSVSQGQPVAVKISVINTGREPARNFVYQLTPIIASADDSTASGWLSTNIRQSVAACLKSQSIPGAQVLFPSTGFGGGFVFSQQFPKEMITKEIVDGTFVLVVEGCLIYDAANKTRHSTFCYFYRGKATKPDNLNLCSGGNTAD